MEYAQSVHGRITYRRAESAINAKIESLQRAEECYPAVGLMYENLEYAIETLRSMRDELKWRDATKTWPMPL